MTTTALHALSDRRGDRLRLPGDPRWDEVRRPWNLAVDQHPVAVAAPADVDELRALVEAARADGVRLAPQSTGHGARGHAMGAVLVRLGAFDELQIDASARVARVGAGVQWGRVLEALRGTGLVALAGSNPVVGVTGYLLSGGHSWFSRSFGLGAGSVRAVDLLSVDGRHRRLTDDDAELMWALRGAGGALGIVTAVEIDLFPVDELVGGRLVFDGADLDAVFAAALEAGAAAPAGVELHTGAMRFPDAEAVPPPLRGRTIVTVQAVSIAGAPALDAVLAPVRAAGTVLDDTIHPIEVDELATVAQEPTDPSGSYGAARFAELDAASLARAIEAWRSPGAAAVAGIEFRLLGGALAAESAHPAISGTVSASHTLGLRAFAAAPGAEAAAAAGFASVFASVADALPGGVFASFLESEPGYGAAYSAASVARAAAVRDRLDPEGLLLGNRSYT